MDYVPVEKILSPITMTRKLFYITIGLLLVMSVLASFMLYRNVQIPIGKMMQSVQKVKRGDLSARIHYKAKMNLISSFSVSMKWRNKFKCWSKTYMRRKFVPARQP